MIDEINAVIITETDFCDLYGAYGFLSDNQVLLFKLLRNKLKFNDWNVNKEFEIDIIKVAKNLGLSVTRAENLIQHWLRIGWLGNGKAKRSISLDVTCENNNLFRFGELFNGYRHTGN